LRILRFALGIDHTNHSQQPVDITAVAGMDRDLDEVVFLRSGDPPAILTLVVVEPAVDHLGQLGRDLDVLVLRADDQTDLAVLLNAAPT